MRVPGASSGSRRAIGSALAIAAFAVGTTAGVLAGWTCADAVLVAAPALLPLVIARAAVARRRSLTQQAVALVVLTVGGTAWLGARRAALLVGRVACDSLLANAALLLGLVVVLRVGAELARAALLRLLRRPWLAAIAHGALLFAVLPPLLLCVLQCHQVAIVSEFATHAPRREVRFAGAGGVRLAGTLLTQTGGGAGVVVCHGLGANRADVLAIAEAAHALGCQVLLFDLRGHGASGGFATTLGAREADDVRAAIDVLLADPRTTGPRVALVGVSMGGAAVLRAAATDPRVAAVFAEASFADLEAMIGERVDVLPGPLRTAFVALTRCWAVLTPGIDPGTVSPRSSLARLAPNVRVALAHGAEDATVPLAQAQQLAAARPDLRCEVFAGAGHGACHAADPIRYERLLASVLAGLSPAGR